MLACAEAIHILCQSVKRVYRNARNAHANHDTKCCTCYTVMSFVDGVQRFSMHVQGSTACYMPKSTCVCDEDILSVEKFT